MIAKTNNAVEKTINLYSGLGWKSYFAKIRFWDAPYKEVEELLPNAGVIIDFGCGEGLFSNYIALASKKRKVFGIDIDKKRLTSADRGLPNTSFMLGDVNKVKIPSADVIVLMHLLHHLDSYKGQEELLNMCKSKLSIGGKLIIIEIEPKISLKFILTYFVDHFLVPLLFENKLYSSIYFRKKREWISLLNKIGFKVNYYPADKGKPFSHVIFECRKSP